MSSSEDPDVLAAGEARKASAPQEPLAEQEDDGLILWMLSLTPTQRLEVAQGFVDSVRVLRKEEANRDKDQATLPVLRRTLRLKSGAQE